MKIIQVNVQAEDGGAQYFSLWLKGKLLKPGVISENLYLYKKFENNVAEDGEVILTSKPKNFIDITKLILRLRRLTKHADVLICHNPISLFFILITSFPRFNRKRFLFVQHSQTWFYKTAVRISLNSVLRVFPQIICVSIFEDQGLVNFEYIPNPVRQIVFNRVEKPSDRFNLIVVARHAREKNIGALISGLANCDDFHVTFVGQGPLTQDLMQAAREKLNLEQFDFVGTLSNGEILKLMQNSDGFLSASVHEGLPLTCLEAVACRLPMLLSDIPGHVLFQKFGVALTFDLNRQKDFALVLEEFRLKIRENRFEAAFDAMQEELNEDRIFSKWKHLIFNE